MNRMLIQFQDAVRMRRFMLYRRNDPGGVSGTGNVAEGIVFSGGEVVLHWLRAPGGINLYRSLGDLLDVHGHQGQTRVSFLDSVSRQRIPERMSLVKKGAPMAAHDLEGAR